MAKARALDKRRKSIRNIRKITRTMELIATARFKKAMDRAHAATAYTRRITGLVADLAGAGLEVKHPLLEGREKTNRAVLLVLTANRGLCGGYNGGVQRAGFARYQELLDEVPEVSLVFMRGGPHHDRVLVHDLLDLPVEIGCVERHRAPDPGQIVVIEDDDPSSAHEVPKVVQVHEDPVKAVIAVDERQVECPAVGKESGQRYLRFG